MLTVHQIQIRENQKKAGNFQKTKCKMAGPSVRSVYLITYSQAAEEWTRESFSNAVVRAFENAEARVRQWVCAKEPHQDGGVHFHLALKLHRQKRWLRVRNSIARDHDINVNFSDSHANYFDAWEYTTKSDPTFIQSEGHPDLSAGFVPRTASAMNARRSTSAATIGEGSTMKRKFDVLDLSDVIVAKNIKTKDALLQLAHEQRQEGKRDLTLFVLNNVDKCVKLITTTWEMENVRIELARKQKSRMELLREFLDKDCVENCNGQWLAYALQTLQRNNFGVGEFSTAVRRLLQLGRGKHRNILITGPSNCGKSFMLNPLTKVFRSFTNPAQGTFAWIGAEKAEVIYLNDLRWSEKLIPWNNFLQLLEGAEVHLQAPKNHSPEDIKFSQDTPIFATSIAPIRKYQAGIVHEGETEMMTNRWKLIRFTYQMAEAEIKELDDCPHCFSKLVFRF